MSKVGNNPIMATVNGKLGDIVVYRRVRGKLIMCKPPKKRDVLTPSQEERKERFLEAVAYAKAQLANETSKAEYTSGITPRLTSAYLVALTDYLRAPEIKDLDVSQYNGAIGDVLEMKVSDDFKVVSVQVEIRDAAKALIERGDAVLREASNSKWSYTTTKPNVALVGTTITIRAKDKADNTTVLEKVL
ncbi:hypothetical protein [Chryseosolibacter indicus]|uniref:Uncharacterized protein n=1 Tax=Chryseosolibacter indicus TaxID=2782351 RepID=A0ABS5VTV8_9BACT|nr:hypothetical protein [Chryseosolibacter indicus]MBT1704766.1 hypothetical protein [Chryseosolibacter indicus]